MKYQLSRSNNFKRSFKKIRINDEEEASYVDVLFKLLNDIELEEKYKDHQLKGGLKEFRECHIKPDLLLMYTIIDDVLELVNIGSHSEIFKNKTLYTPVVKSPLLSIP